MYNGKKIMYLCLLNYRISNGFINVVILFRLFGIIYICVIFGYILISYVVRVRIL